MFSAGSFASKSGAAYSEWQVHWQPRRALQPESSVIVNTREVNCEAHLAQAGHAVHLALSMPDPFCFLWDSV